MNSQQSSLDRQLLAPSQSIEATVGSDVISNGPSVSSEPIQVNITCLFN